MELEWNFWIHFATVSSYASAHGLTHTKAPIRVCYYNLQNCLHIEKIYKNGKNNDYNGWR